MAFLVTIVWRRSKAGECPLVGIQKSPSGAGEAGGSSGAGKTT